MAGIYRAVMSGTYQGELYQNVWHIKDLGTSTGNPAIDVANDIINEYMTNLKFIYSSDFVFASVNVESLLEVSGPLGLVNFTAGSKGSLAGSSFPPAAAICWSLQTTRPGRSGLGHLFHGGVVNGDVSNGSLNITGAGRHNTRVTNLLARIGPNGTSNRFRWGVWSKKIAGPHKPYSASAWAQVTSVFVNYIVTHHNNRRPFTIRQ